MSDECRREIKTPIGGASAVTSATHTAAAAAAALLTICRWLPSFIAASIAGDNSGQSRESCRKHASPRRIGKGGTVFLPPMAA